MINVETKGIVLHRAEYRDTDRMLTIISPEIGRVDIMAKGIRKPTAKLHAASELFTRGTFQLVENGERYTLTGFQLDNAYTPMRSDYTRLSLASYALGLTLAAVQENLPASYLFENLRITLEEFCDEDSLNDNPVKTALMFIMRFAAIEGIFPILDKCCICGESDGQLNRFAMSDSGLCHKNCAPYSIAVNDKIITTLRHCAESEPIVEDDPTILKTFGLMRTYVKEQLGFAVKAEKALDDIL